MKCVYGGLKDWFCRADCSIFFFKANGILSNFTRGYAISYSNSARIPINFKEYKDIKSNVNHTTRYIS